VLAGPDFLPFFAGVFSLSAHYRLFVLIVIFSGTYDAALHFRLRRALFVLHVLSHALIF